MPKKTRTLLYRNPFREEISEKYFYQYPALKQRYKLLLRLYEGESKLVFIIGESGSGKTLLLNQFLAHNEDKWRKCTIRLFDSQMPTVDENDSEVEEFIGYINVDKDFPVIAIDNAQQLNDASLFFYIRNLEEEAENRRLRQLFIFSDSVILQKMSAIEDQLTGGVIIEKVFMPTLTYKETYEYISRRVYATGYTGKYPFSRPDLKKIFQKSGGIPGNINTLAGRYLKEKIQTRGKVSSILKKMINSFGPPK